MHTTLAVPLLGEQLYRRSTATVEKIMAGGGGKKRNNEGAGKDLCCAGTDYLRHNWLSKEQWLY